MFDQQSHNLTIPRGVALFAQYESGTQNPGAYRDLGNMPEFTLTRATDMLAHYSSRGGTRTKDAEISVNSDITGTVTMDDVNPDNMGFWFMKTPQVVTIASATGETETITVSPGGIYQIGRSDLAPLGLRGISNLVVEDEGGAGDTYDLTDDYTLDGDNGLLTITSGGAIAADTSVDLTYDVAASTYKQIETGDTAIEGELKFISQNPYGPNRIIVIPRAKIMPTGDLALMGDPESPAWQQIQFSISVLKKGRMALAYNADGLAAFATA